MKYSPKEERPGRAQRRQTNGRGRCSWGRAGAGGVRKFPDGGELRAEQVIEHLAHGRGHVLHKGFQGRELYTDGRSRASVRHGGLGLAPGRRLGGERGLVHLVRPFHHSPSCRVRRVALPPPPPTPRPPRRAPLPARPPASSLASSRSISPFFFRPPGGPLRSRWQAMRAPDRKSTRLNSSHLVI